MASDPFLESNFTIASPPDPCDDAGTLKAKAERCRRLAAGISDKQAAEVLKGMADSYEQAFSRLTDPPKAD